MNKAFTQIFLRTNFLTITANGYLIQRVSSSSSSAVRIVKTRLKKMSSVTTNNTNLSALQTPTDNNDTSDSRKFEMLESLVNKYRQWYHTSLGKAYLNCDKKFTQNGEFVFKLMSYNILAQELLNTHKYLYQNHDQSALNWSHRFHRIVMEIEQILPEILCMQEVQTGHLDVIKNGLQAINLNYNCIYKKRTGNKTDGCAIFYNKDLFNLIESINVEYEQPGIELLNRENVAIIAKFSLKSDPNMKFIVATTHLLYNPRRQDVRLAQIQILLAEVDRIARIENTNEYLPVILTGDFNLQPFSAPFELITKGNLSYANLTKRTLNSNPFNNATNGRKLLPIKLGITDNCQHVNTVRTETKLYHSEKSKSNEECNEEDIELTQEIVDLFQTGRLRHDFNFRSAYFPFDAFASTHQDDWILVDYIFYTASQNNRNANRQKIPNSNLQLLSYLQLPSPIQCDEIGMIPNKFLGSDHMSLTAKFLLKSNETFKVKGLL